MSAYEKLQFKLHRPAGKISPSDHSLIDLAASLRRQLHKGIHTLGFGRLNDDNVSRLALLLVDFAEDAHANIGLWTALEAAQRLLHGTPLPFVVPIGETPELTPFDSRRIRYLLWTVFPNFWPDTAVGPSHSGLLKLADMVSLFLSDKCAHLPSDSPVSLFLRAPHSAAWQVKRKLFWLGTQSYLCRHLMAGLADVLADEDDPIAIIDEYLMTSGSTWAGLGPLELLAEILQLPADEDRDFRAWSQRHTAPYRVENMVLSGGITETLSVRNLISNKDYLVRIDDRQELFENGMYVVGSLVPWHGEWAWSGSQQPLKSLSAREVEELRQNFITNMRSMVYAYLPDLLEKACSRSAEHHDSFVKYYGDELVIFTGGLTLAAEEKARLRQINMELGAPPDKRDVNISFPDELLRHEEGIALFSSPLDGTSLFRFYINLETALGKAGIGLIQKDVDAIFHLIENRSISPDFARRILRDHGMISVNAAYALNEPNHAAALEMLLRRHKSHFYRNRYPAISLVGV